MDDIKEQSKKKLKELVEQFENDPHKDKLSEMEFRSNYIAPFIKLLGYSNEHKGYADWEILEAKRTKQNKEVDYKINVDRKPIFIVEAKKDIVNINTDEEAIFQIKNYCYHEGIIIGILTNFRDFRIFLSIGAPDIEAPKIGSLESFNYTEYLNNYDFIYNTFSKQAILNRSIETYIGSKITGLKSLKKSEKQVIELEIFRERGREALDNDFLLFLDKWRSKIAQSLATNNESMNENDILAYTQKLIDRILFIKICEDSDITEADDLLKISSTKDVYQSLLDMFEKLNDSFNGSLFTPDDKLNSIKIDNDVLEKFIKSFYYMGKKKQYKVSQYLFNIIRVEILGGIYEKFLGKIIKLGTNRKVIFVDKPEVKKNKGVFYTPEYIVDYIVENTVGKKTAGKTPKELTKLKILDPACGSGSFLIGAFDYLIKYHETYYTENHKSGKNKDDYTINENGIATLTTDKKAEILKNNIFGVDIDPQAVEVTKLSLYIKMIDKGRFQLHLLTHPLLPSLKSNIKCGNSLIGNDIMLNKQIKRFAEEKKTELNMFDWESESGFSSIMSKGKFDCIIGNPPYIFARNEGFEDFEKIYYYNKYKLSEYQLNTYIMFTEQAHNLLSNDGNFGYIIPNNWLTIDKASLFRNFVLNECKEQIIINSYYKVFKGANVDTSLLIYSKKGGDTLSFYKLIDNVKHNFEFIGKKPANLFTKSKENIINFEILGSKSGQDLNDKIEKNKFLLGEPNITLIKAGIKAYEVGKGIPTQTKQMQSDRVYHSQKDMTGQKSWYKYLDGRDVIRYKLDWSGNFIKYGDNLAAKRTFDLFECDRILVRQIPNKPPYCLHSTITHEIYINDLNSMILKPTGNYNIEVILGILNSKLISFWFINKFGKLQRGIYPQFKIKELKLFPIPKLTKDKKWEELKGLVGDMLKAANKKDNIREIDFLNMTIDNIVYDLYDISGAERKQIENGLNIK